MRAQRALSSRFSSAGLWREATPIPHYFLKSFVRKAIHFASALLLVDKSAFTDCPAEDSNALPVSRSCEWQTAGKHSVFVPGLKREANTQLDILMRVWTNIENKNRDSPLFRLFLYANDTHSSNFQISCCVKEATWIGRLLFLWQQKRKLKQGHVNWPRYCNHVHKGQYPAWEETSTFCRPRQLLYSSGGLYFNTPALLWKLASEKSLGCISWNSPSFYPALYHLHHSPPSRPFPLCHTCALRWRSSFGSTIWLICPNWVMEGQYWSI